MVCKCGEHKEEHVLYIIAYLMEGVTDHDTLMGPLCPGQLDGIDVYEAGEKEEDI